MTDTSPPNEVVDLDALLDRDVPGWRPKPGDKIIGTVVARDTGGQGSTYGVYPLLTIQRDDGTLVAVHAFHQVLKNGVSEVQRGDRIGIKYLGENKEGGGYGGYEDYRVRVQR